MIAIFKNNLFANSLLLLPYTLVVRLSTLLYPTAYVAAEKDTLLTRYIFEHIPNPLLQSVLACVLIFLQAVAVNRLCVKNRLGAHITLLSGVGYILLTSFMPEYLALSPSLLANTFLLWGFIELFEVYKKVYTSVSLFNMGFALGGASLIIPSLYVFLLFGIIGTMILKSFSIAQMLQSVIGFVACIYIFYGFSVVGDAAVGAELSKYSLSFNIAMISGFRDFLPLFLFLAGLITLAILGYNNYMLKKSIQVQKKIDLLYWAMLFSLIAAFFANTLQFHQVLLAFVPLSILLHMSFLKIKEPIIQELVHLAALSLLFLIHFGVI